MCASPGRIWKGRAITQPAYLYASGYCSAGSSARWLQALVEVHSQQSSPARLASPTVRLRHTHTVRWAVATTVLLALIVVGAFHVAATGDAHGGSDSRESKGNLVILQFQPMRLDASLPVYRGLLETMPSDTRFVVGVGSPRHEAEFRRALGPVLGWDPRVKFLCVQRPLGPWVRDRFIPFYKDGERHLYVPDERSVHPMEIGSLDVAALLQERDPSLHFSPSTLKLAGGDVILTRRHILIGHGTVFRHTRGILEGERDFRSDVETLFGRELVIVGRGAEPLPYNHIDMFLSATNEKTLLLGDPAMAMRTLYPGRRAPAVLVDNDLGRFVRPTQEKLVPRYRRLAEQLEASGFRIVRVPILHGEPMPDGRPTTILNWNNALLDRRAARAYVPRYGMPALDEQAWRIWRREGFEVLPIAARAAIVCGGSVRCLTTAYFQQPHVAE